MSNFKPVCQLCKHLAITQAVTFTGGNLVLNLPDDRAYTNGEKVCIVVAQTIPDTATINAPVGVTIGTGTTVYPLTNRCCAQVTAGGIQTRTRYATVVSTNAAGGGAFKLLGAPRYCAPDRSAVSLNPTPAPAPTAAAEAAEIPAARAAKGGKNA